MKVSRNVLFTITLFLALVLSQFASPSRVFAAGTVGDGTSGSCTESALDGALSGGGTVTFNCGSSPVTITVSGTKTISSNTSIDGSGLVTISGGNTYRVFEVASGVTFNITGLTVRNGYFAYTFPEGTPTGQIPVDLPMGGGAMLINSGATVNIHTSTFDNNHGMNVYGGAIYVKSATLDITDSTFSNNNTSVEQLGPFALGGGAIQNDYGTITVDNSTFHDNNVTSTSADGGTIYNGTLSGLNSGTLTVINSTFFHNQLVGDTSGSSGGAIRSNGILVIKHSTFEKNDGGISGLDLGDGGSGAVTIGDGHFTLINNIFSNSPTASTLYHGPYDCVARGSAIVQTSSGNIMESSYGCGEAASTDDPNFEITLGDHGGPTQTLDFAGSSFAIDAVACASGVTTDQRGIARPVGTACDIGALEVERSQPTVTVDQAGGQSDPTNASSINFTVVFSEPVIGFATGDVSFTGSTVGGTLTGTVTGGPTTFNVAVTGMTTPGQVVVSISAGVATDAAMNLNVASTGGDNSVSYDHTGPVATVSKASGQADPTNGSSVNFEVVFDESVTGFDASDVNLGGTASPTTAQVTGDGTTYDVQVGGFGGDGTVTASVKQGAVTDALGNSNAESNAATVNRDATVPTVTINQKVGQVDPTNTAPIEFTVVFSETMTGFTDSDVTLSSGTASISGTGPTYTVSVTGMSQGVLTASIGSDVATDAAGNGNDASTSFDNHVTYDTTGPTVTINQAAGQSDPTGSVPVNFKAIFSVAVTGLDSSDVSVSGTASGVKTATITEIAPNDGTTFNIAISGMTTSGTVIVSIPSSVVLDGDGNPNFASTSTDNTVTVNFVKPGVPVLTAPLSGALVSSLQPLLNWSDSAPVAQYYQVQISRVSTFTTTVLDQSNVAVSEFTPSTDLLPGVLYYWRVRAFNAIGVASNWSGARSFKTALQAPVLTSPSTNAVLDVDRPTFIWESVPGAVSYTLQISTVNNFSTLVATRNATSTSYTMITDLVQNKLLYWRVLAKTSVVTSAWSAVQSFTTGNPPTVPTLVAPASNALLTTLTPFFDWSNSTLPAPLNSTNNLRYQIQIADNTDFTAAISHEIAPVNGVTASQYQSVLTDGFQFNETYYWRVRSVNSFNSVDQFSAWSTVFYFRTVIAKPVLVSPDNTTTPALGTRRPLFDWQNADGATGYRIAVSRYSNMASPLLNTTSVLSVYTPTTDLPANTTLYWRVQATGLNGPSAWSDTWTFKTGNPPSVPVLVTPASNALVTNYQPLFDWGNSTVPAGTFKYYQIQLDNNSDFQSTVFDRFTTSGLLTDSQYQTQSAEVLDPNTTYYWRVRAINTIGGVDHTSGWSIVRTFRTALTPPTSLTATSTLNPNRPLFSWSVVTGATGYTIQISTTPTFSTILIGGGTASGAANTYTPGINLPLNKTLYWRVLAKGTNTSAWAAGPSFMLPLP